MLLFYFFGAIVYLRAAALAASLDTSGALESGSKSGEDMTVNPLTAYNPKSMGWAELHGMHSPHDPIRLYWRIPIPKPPKDNDGYWYRPDGLNAEPQHTVAAITQAFEAMKTPDEESLAATGFKWINVDASKAEQMLMFFTRLDVSAQKMTNMLYRALGLALKCRAPKMYAEEDGVDCGICNDLLVNEPGFTCLKPKEGAEHIFHTKFYQTWMEHSTKKLLEHVDEENNDEYEDEDGDEEEEDGENVDEGDVESDSEEEVREPGDCCFRCGKMGTRYEESNISSLI